MRITGKREEVGAGEADNGGVLGGAGIRLDEEGGWEMSKKCGRMCNGQMDDWGRGRGGLSEVSV